MGVLGKSRSGDFDQNDDICQNFVLTNRILDNEKKQFGNIKK